MREAAKRYAHRFVDGYYYNKEYEHDPNYAMDITMCTCLDDFKDSYVNIEYFDVDIATLMIVKIKDKVTIDEFVGVLAKLGEAEVLAYVMQYFKTHGISTQSLEEL